MPRRQCRDRSPRWRIRNLRTQIRIGVLQRHCPSQTIEEPRLAYRFRGRGVESGRLQGGIVRSMPKLVERNQAHLAQPRVGMHRPAEFDTVQRTGIEIYQRGVETTRRRMRAEENFERFGSGERSLAFKSHRAYLPTYPLRRSAICVYDQHPFSAQPRACIRLALATPGSLRNLAANENGEPCPTTLSTFSVPPINSTIGAEIASPRPV